MFMKKFALTCAFRGRNPMNPNERGKSNGPTDEYSRTLRARDYKSPPYAWSFILRRARTEFGKQMRKAYESHQVSLRRKQMTAVEIRTDGLSNTLSTVEKDNYLLVITKR